ncbi:MULTISPECIES: LysR family transcriptional regulator [Thalassospira]|jgi:DNA-binding transcriptional LysR family regulator|uniref:LysR family transcriptional regulator n=1 Tax=Thalassospira povalilytica TaxID=732237 RepID=A0A8I1SHQ8_9PROT|nr:MULTISPECIES: LysR family transcriptional regulator [Thalassospira]KZB69841.1 LysR family transcriptional regulator [Thalassospira sp. MCCC 1A02491]MBN8196582.1 LysR family transcriptional regulator [Thalassospira povalilytica]URK18039.1 LysR family transcriptional regulator [Thalassospira sp. GO-4]
MNWNDLRFFVAVAQAGTLSGAARRLGKDHTTVARRIEALEADLGAHLFDRLATGWKLTEAGENLVPVAGRIEEDVLAFERQARGDETAHGVVRIAVPPAAGRLLFAPRLAELLRDQKNLEYEILGSSVIANLARREADVAVRMATPDQSGLIVRKLTNLRFAVYAAKGYTDRVPRKDWEFCADGRNTFGDYQQGWVWETLEQELPMRVKADDSQTVLAFVAAGHGLGLLPRYMADLDDRLELVFDDKLGEVSKPVWLVVHPDMRRSPGVRMVMDALIKATESIPAQFKS